MSSQVGPQSRLMCRQKRRISDVGNYGDGLLSAHWILCWVGIHVHHGLVQISLLRDFQRDILETKADDGRVLLKTFQWPPTALRIKCNPFTMARDWVLAYFLWILWCHCLPSSVRPGKDGPTLGSHSLDRLHVINAQKNKCTKEH